MVRYLHRLHFTGCQHNEFTCNSGECIAYTLRCDGHADCYDESDEHSCPTTTHRPPQPTWTTPAPHGCGEGQWQCRSGECIPHSARCDNRYDCNDYSDESECSKCFTFLLFLKYCQSYLLK